MEATSEAACNIPSTTQVFVPQETSDHPFDVTLVVEGGKALKAHECVLSAASPFFHKLFNSDMRESNQGVVRLEVLTELGLRDILEFIYTGSVQISTEDNAQELIAMADYLFLPHLKTVAGRVLLQMLNASNCISMYYFAERYRCEELIADIKKFIFVNFTTIAKTEQFLSLSSKEVKMFISSDEIVVSAEEDVFEIIITWTDCRKSERKKYFADLFREVRLVYVSRDYLHSDIITNDHVNSNDGCMDLVKDALKFIDCKNNLHYTLTPRKSLETPVIVVYMKDDDQKDNVLCYYPREDKWTRFQSAISSYIDVVTSCRGKLYFLSQEDKRIILYDSYFNCWKSLPFEEEWTFRKFFVRNEDEIYALVSELRRCRECGWAWRHRGETNLLCEKSHVSLKTLNITKYKPELNSWHRVSSFNVGRRVGMCVVCSGNFIYFIGGTALANGPKRIQLAEADRYDLISDTWDKIADIQEPRSRAHGVAGHGKIFIVGGYNGNLDLESCEVYHEATNEWQFAASLRKPSLSRATLLCVDGKVYLFNGSFYSWRSEKDGVIDCYDFDRNEWKEKTRIPIEMIRSQRTSFTYSLICCSVKVYKECLTNFQNGTADKEAKRKCAVM